MLALVCPGQGSQHHGMLAEWSELPGFADNVSRLSTVAELDLLTLGTCSPTRELTDTAIAQPLIVATGIAAAQELLSNKSIPDVSIRAVAGHSVGEVTAAHVAGVISDEEAMALARDRGRAMAEASKLSATGMAAIVGTSEDSINKAVREFGLEVANWNSKSQVVVAGDQSAITSLANSEIDNVIVKPLAVAGAFHTGSMATAVPKIQSTVTDFDPQAPRTTLLSNLDGKHVSSGEEALRRLVSQVTRPVRWDLCNASLKGMQITGIIELPPAGVLTGLAKRDLKGVERVALKGPGDLERARLLIRDHARFSRSPQQNPIR